MGVLFFHEKIVQKFVDVNLKVVVETFQTFMASESHAVCYSHFLNLNHVGDLRRSKVMALELQWFY